MGKIPEGFTPEYCARTVPKLYCVEALGLALSEKQIPQFVEKNESGWQRMELLEPVCVL